MIKLSTKNKLEDKMMRDVYCETLVNMATEDNRIVLMDADLMHAINTLDFDKKFHERSFNCGIQEANMVGVAAGLSATGKIPYVHTFGCFATRRCYDQIFISVAYAKLNVRIIGSDPGVTAAFNGGTHMPFEDVGIMRNIPNITIIEPTDAVMLADILKKTNEEYGVFYIRLLRKSAVKVFEEGSTFEIGKAVELKEGNDVTIIANGIMVSEALKAAKKLNDDGINARVVNMFTIKPIDKEMIIKCAKETGAIVTAENHNIINGLGSAVAEVLSENIPVPLKRVGVKDLFGEVGPVDYLQKRFELKDDDVVKEVKNILKNK